MLKHAATYAEKRKTNDKSAWHALTRGLRRQAELNRRVASDLPLAFKWLYLLTNAPFFYVGYATLRDGHALPWCGPPAIAAALTLAAPAAKVRQAAIAGGPHQGSAWPSRSVAQPT